MSRSFLDPTVSGWPQTESNILFHPPSVGSSDNKSEKTNPADSLSLSNQRADQKDQGVLDSSWRANLWNTLAVLTTPGGGSAHHIFQLQVNPFDTLFQPEIIALSIQIHI